LPREAPTYALEVVHVEAVYGLPPQDKPLAAIAVVLASLRDLRAFEAVLRVGAGAGEAEREKSLKSISRQA
jgi:hypothetical protein